MKIKDIGIDELEFRDERFRISNYFFPDLLIRSIKEIGLVNPPVVTARNGRLLIVNGWKRVLACRELSLSPLPVFILEEADDLKAFRMSFLENLTVRRFSLLEKSEIIRKLVGFGESEKEIIKTYFPLLAIPPTYDYYTLFLNISHLEPEDKELIHKKNVPLAALERLVEFTPEERRALYPLLLPLGQNKQKDIVEVIQELCLSRGLSIQGILGEKEFKTVLQSGNLSPLQKAEKVSQLLKKKRFPLLSARQEAFVSAKKKLAWPKDIKISPTPFYEDKKMFIEFSFLSKKDFLKKTSALHEAAVSEDFEELFETNEDD
jgi:ParB family chromosome partitioning protein